MFIENERKNYYKQAPSLCTAWTLSTVWGYYLVLKVLGQFHTAKDRLFLVDIWEFSIWKAVLEQPSSWVKFEIASLVVKYEPNDGLPGVSLLHLLLTELHNNFSNEIKEQFFSDVFSNT